MEDLSKAREEICKDCMFGTAIQNCTACLYNNLKRTDEEIFREFDKLPPFSSKNDNKWNNAWDVEKK